jgi:GNAT superfamily N-acetyltransferase
LSIKILKGLPTEQFIVVLDNLASCICTIYHNNKAKVLLVDDVYVEEEFRRCGHGTRLMKAVYNFAKEKNVDCIELAIDVYNSAAIKLYYNVGFYRSDKEQLRMILNKID